MPTTAQDDVELARAWLAGDGGAGAELAERHFVPIHRFFRSRVKEGAEDLAQRTFLACFEALPRFREDSSFRTFIFAIARNLLKQHYEGRGMARPWVDLDSKLNADGPSPSTALRLEDAEQHLRDAVEALPDEFRECVELYYWDELSVREIGYVLDLPAGTIKSRLHRGRTALRAALGEDDPEEPFRE